MSAPRLCLDMVFDFFMEEGEGDFVMCWRLVAFVAVDGLKVGTLACCCVGLVCDCCWEEAEEVGAGETDLSLEWAAL